MQADAARADPVIMLTAQGDEIDRVVGFEVGADDYVTVFGARAYAQGARAAAATRWGGRAC